MRPHIITCNLSQKLANTALTALGDRLNLKTELIDVGVVLFAAIVLNKNPQNTQK